MNNLKLKKQLLPTGRAFVCPPDSNLEKLLKAFAEVEDDVLDDALSVLDSIIPDNDNFSAYDCERWELILSIDNNSEKSVFDRKKEIMRKMAYPINTLGRQHSSYLEYALNLAGFPVKVYEYKDFKNLIRSAEHALTTKHGKTNHGGLMFPEYTSYIVNHIDEDLEEVFPMKTETANCAFYIAGDTFNDYVPILQERYAEFRQIIIQIKPVGTVGFLRIAPTAVFWILDTGTWNDSGYWFGTSLWKNN